MKLCQVSTVMMFGIVIFMMACSPNKYNQKHNRIMIELIDKKNIEKYSIVLRSRLSNCYSNIDFRMFYDSSHSYFEYDFINDVIDQNTRNVIDSTLYKGIKNRTKTDEQIKLSNELYELLTNLPNKIMLRNIVWGDCNKFIIEDYNKRMRKEIEIHISDDLKFNNECEKIILSLMETVKNTECQFYLEKFYKAGKCY